VYSVVLVGAAYRLSNVHVPVVSLNFTESVPDNLKAGSNVLDAVTFPRFVSLAASL